MNAYHSSPNNNLSFNLNFSYVSIPSVLDTIAPYITSVELNTLVSFSFLIMRND